MTEQMHYGKVMIPAGDVTDKVITGLGFQPTDILFRGVDCDAHETLSGGAHGTTQNCTFYKVTAGASNCGNDSTHAVASTNLQARIFSMDPNGFTMKIDLNTLTSTHEIGYLAWRSV